MIIPKPLLLIMMTVMLVTSSVQLNAARESTNIEISAVFDEYVRLVGTAVGASRFFSADDVRSIGKGNKAVGPSHSLGTLGLASNMVGNCTLNFTTQNNFSLLHIVNGQKLASYELNYQSTVFAAGSPSDMLLPCNTVPESLNFNTVGNFKKKPKAGVYQDIVNVVVTTE